MGPEEVFLTRFLVMLVMLAREHTQNPLFCHCPLPAGTLACFSFYSEPLSTCWVLGAWGHGDIFL